jgi:hypothetical protein
VAAVSWAGFAAGIAILVLTAASVFGTLVVPRATAPRLTVLITGTVQRAFLLVTDRVDDYLARDRIEALIGPVLLIGLLVAWVGLVFLSFALLFWPFVGGFGTALQITGSSMFTLGFTTGVPPRSRSPSSAPPAAWCSWPSRSPTSPPSMRPSTAARRS